MRAPRKYGRNHERPLLWKTTVVEDYRGGKQLGWKAGVKGQNVCPESRIFTD